MWASGALLGRERRLGALDEDTLASRSTLATVARLRNKHGTAVNARSDQAGISPLPMPKNSEVFFCATRNGVAPVSPQAPSPIYNLRACLPPKPEHVIKEVSHKMKA